MVSKDEEEKNNYAGCLKALKQHANSIGLFI